MISKAIYELEQLSTVSLPHEMAAAAQQDEYFSRRKIAVFDRWATAGERNSVLSKD